MKYRIYWHHNNYTDYLVVEGETIEEIQKIAGSELEARGVPVDCAWSEEVS